MNMENNSFVEALKSDGAKQLIPKIYDDLLQPGVRKVGIALETVLNLSNVILLPLRLVNEKSSVWFQKNMEDYKRKIENIPEANIVDVPPELGVPILETLTFTTNEDLADLLTTLLAKASDDRTANQAHPGFTQILQRISVDEARIIKHLGTGQPKHFSSSAKAYHNEVPNKKIQLPIDAIYYVKLSNKLGYKYSPEAFELFAKTDIQFDVELLFPKNIVAYLDNLSSLGVLRASFTSEGKNNYHIDIINHIKIIAYQDEGSRSFFDGIAHDDENLFFSRYFLTDYGTLFVNACNSNKM